MRPPVRRGTIHGDSIGDDVTIGDISSAHGIAIGRDARSWIVDARNLPEQYETTAHVPDAPSGDSPTFEVVLDNLKSLHLSDDVESRLMKSIQMIDAEITRGDDANIRSLRRMLHDVMEYAPQLLGVVHAWLLDDPRSSTTVKIYISDSALS